MTVDKIRGQERDLRHILLTPKVSDEDVRNTVKELDSIRTLIMDEKMSFAQAAILFSDEKNQI